MPECFGVVRDGKEIVDFFDVVTVSVCFNDVSFLGADDKKVF